MVVFLHHNTNISGLVFTECCSQMLLRRSVALLQCNEDMQG